MTLRPRALSGPRLPSRVTPKRQLGEGSSHAVTPAPGASVIRSRELGWQLGQAPAAHASGTSCCPRAGPLSRDPPQPGLPVAPSWQSLGLGALHPGSVMGRGAPRPSLQESGQREARGRAAQCTAGGAQAPAAWAGQEASQGGGCGTRDLCSLGP